MNNNQTLAGAGYHLDLVYVPITAGDLRRSVRTADKRANFIWNYSAGGLPPAAPKIKLSEALTVAADYKRFPTRDHALLARLVTDDTADDTVVTFEVRAILAGDQWPKKRGTRKLAVVYSDGTVGVVYGAQPVIAQIPDWDGLIGQAIVTLRLTAVDFENYAQIGSPSELNRFPRVPYHSTVGTD